MNTSTLGAMYAERCATPSDVYLHLPRFHELVVSMGAQHVIELGTRTGVSTVAFLYALEQTGGRLTSVDIDEQPNIGCWPHWTFVQSDDLAPDLFAALEPADIVFIDTSHHYDQTVAELNLYQWGVKPGGVILLHDTELERPEGAPLWPPYPVKRAATEFCEQNGYTFTNNPACWGLGEIRGF